MHRNIHSEAKSTNKDGLTIYTKKLGQIQKRSPMLGSKEKIRTSEPNSVEEITLTSHKLCEDYIHARLRRSGISDFDLASALSQTDCSMTLQSMGKILELRYPKLFSKISVHLRITYSNEAVVLGAFNKFAANLFIDGITWARIVALFAFAGGLAVDCTAHGRAIFLGRIGYWLAAFVAKNLSEWIKQHGGWNGLVLHFSKKNNKHDRDVNEQQKSALKKIWSWYTPTVNYVVFVALTSSFVVIAASLSAILLSTDGNKLL